MGIIIWKIFIETNFSVFSKYFIFFTVYDFEQLNKYGTLKKNKEKFQPF